MHYKNRSWIQVSQSQENVHHCGGGRGGGKRGGKLVNYNYMYLAGWLTVYVNLLKKTTF